MARRRRTITAAIAFWSFRRSWPLATCPPPFESAVASPGAESAKAPGVHAAGTGSVLGERTGIAAGSAILWAQRRGPQPPARRRSPRPAPAGSRSTSTGTRSRAPARAASGGTRPTAWSSRPGPAASRSSASSPTPRPGPAPRTARPAPTSACRRAPSPSPTSPRAAAQRYGTASTDRGLRSSITVWQIWNEPNHYPFVQPTVDVGVLHARC